MSVLHLETFSLQLEAPSSFNLCVRSLGWESQIHRSERGLSLERELGQQGWGEPTGVAFWNLYSPQPRMLRMPCSPAHQKLRDSTSQLPLKTPLSEVLAVNHAHNPLTYKYQKGWEEGWIEPEWRWQPCCELCPEALGVWSIVLAHRCRNSYLCFKKLSSMTTHELRRGPT